MSQRMTTDELIRALREWADQTAMWGRIRLVQEAADRLEELDERIAIMEEGRGEESPHPSPAATPSPQGEGFWTEGAAAPLKGGRLGDDYDEHRYTGLISEE